MANHSAMEANSHTTDRYFQRIFFLDWAFLKGPTSQKAAHGIFQYHLLRKPRAHLVTSSFRLDLHEFIIPGYKVAVSVNR